MRRIQGRLYTGSNLLLAAPRGFGTELNELSLHIVQNSGLELAGKLTAESYCEQITMSTKISGDNKGGIGFDSEVLKFYFASIAEYL